MSNKNQSSIEWLYEQLTLTWYDYNSGKDLLDKAKEMHKEEMVNTWTETTAPTHEIGLSDTTYILAQIKKAEQYYNETFKSNET